MEEYRNILANKFMRDTNYIIIKDTDDLEELERQWELFQSSLLFRPVFVYILLFLSAIHSQHEDHFGTVSFC